MALALADSLLPATAGADPRAAQFDPDDQGRRIVAWWRESAYTPDDNTDLFSLLNSSASTTSSSYSASSQQSLLASLFGTDSNS